MIIYEIYSHVVIDTLNLAELLVKDVLLSAQARLGSIVVYLQGDLGAGKTTFVRGMLAGLGFMGTVKSPTYTIVETYNETIVPFYHFDLYRLKVAKELELLGIRDYLQEPGICCFEWPAKGIGYIPVANFMIHLEIIEQDQRKIVISN